MLGMKLRKGGLYMSHGHVASRPSGFAGGFAFILVLFILLAIIGASYVY